MRRGQDPGFPMRQEDIDRFLAERSEQSHRPGTTRRYRSALTMLYDWLPEDKRIREGSVDQWLSALAAEGYSNNTLNLFGAVCDLWLRYVGAERYQRTERIGPGETSIPAVSREEYHRLLEAAKELRDERSYLLIKVFANTGVTARELSLLTADAAREGCILSGKKTIHLPEALRKELLNYAEYNGHPAGVIFRSKNGGALQAAWIARCLKHVSQQAGLAGGKGTPASLRKLYGNTMAALPDEHALDDLLEQEQTLYGWKPAQAPDLVQEQPPAVPLPEPDIQPQAGITREEYLRLLDTAKQLGREQAYLLAKVFASTGVSVSELPALTVEAVRAGRVALPDGSVPLAPGMQNELLSYAARKNILSGPVFATRSGRHLDVQRVSNMLRQLGAAAGLDPGKSRPKALRKLYLSARSEAEMRAAGMAERLMNERADAEQAALSGPQGAEDTSLPSPDNDPGFLMTREAIEGYMADLRAKGRMPASRRYGSILEQLYEDLPEDKRIRRGTLAQWVELLQDKGYAPNTINGFAIVANGFLDHAGHRECQLSSLPKLADIPQPELTRSEYLQLLQAAKRLDREREYLLVRLFASCDLPVQELDKVTVAAARAGSMTVDSSGTRSVLHLPGSLCRELLAYAERQGIGTGPIFVSNRDRAMSRAAVVPSIAKLSDEAGLPGEKCNPQCLRRLYKTTRAAVEASFAVLVEQTMDRQAEQEQLAAGWGA